ncbi:MAG TPA: response regulator [Planctomycetota bacterium]
MRTMTSSLRERVAARAGQEEAAILFAEPSPNRHAAVHRALAARNCRVMTAGTTDALLAAIRGTTPDVVVLDERVGSAAPGVLLRLLSDLLPGAGIVLLRDVRGAEERMSEVSPDVLFRRARGASDDELLGVVAEAVETVQGGPKRGLWRSGLVVCVDSDSLFLRLLGRMLSRGGHRPVAYESLSLAVDMLPEIRPDLLLLDGKLPHWGTSGYGRWRDHVRADDGTELPVILLLDDETERKRHADIGENATYALTKPLNPRRLLELVDRLLEIPSPRA